MRPESIVNFERCYLGAIGVGLLNSVMTYSTAQALVERTRSLPTWYLPVTIVVSLVVQLLLWYFIARGGSTVAKWIFTVLFALGTGGLIYTASMGSFPKGLAGVLAIVAYVLQAVAVWLMFKPDATRWFEHRGEDLRNTFS